MSTNNAVSLLDAREVISFLAEYRKSGFEGVMGVRLGLQLLELVVCRIEVGKPIEDLLNSDHAPSRHIAELRDLYAAYRGKSIPKDKILKQLTSFNERYVEFAVEHGFPEEIVRATGVRQAVKSISKKTVSTRSRSTSRNKR